MTTSADSSQDLVPNNYFQSKYGKFSNYLQAAQSFWQTGISRNQKGFLGLLGLALVVYKRDKLMALLVAAKNYICRRKLEYAVFTMIIEGLRRNHIVFNNPARALSAELPDEIKNLPGETYILDLNEVNENYYGIFEETVAKSREQKSSFILAKLLMSDEDGEYVRYCDSKELHAAMFPDEHLFGLSYEYPLTIVFADQNIEEIHYFGLDLLSGKFTHIGSNYDLQDNSPEQEAKLKPFVAAIIANGEEIYGHLKQFQDTTLKNLDNADLYEIKRYVRILKLIIAQLEEKSLCNVRAKYILSDIYYYQDQIDEARNLLNTCNVEKVDDEHLVNAIKTLKQVLEVDPDNMDM